MLSSFANYAGLASEDLRLDVDSLPAAELTLVFEVPLRIRYQNSRLASSACGNDGGDVTEHLVWSSGKRD
jgi:hypothetical protein